MSDHITLIGNIVGDLEQRATRGGGTIAAFRLAVGERRFDREKGEWTDGHTNYYAVSVFGELGAHALRSLHKGERVILAGRLRLREWETETKRGVSADVVADAIGHDLRWGISHFDRTPKPPSGEQRVAEQTHAADGTWAVPGASFESRADAASEPALIASSSADATAGDRTDGRAAVVDARPATGMTMTTVPPDETPF